MSGAPFKKLPASPSVSGSSVPVADRGGEEVNVGFSDFGAGSGDLTQTVRQAPTSAVQVLGFTPWFYLVKEFLSRVESGLQPGQTARTYGRDMTKCFVTLMWRSGGKTAFGRWRSGNNPFRPDQKAKRGANSVETEW